MGKNKPPTSNLDTTALKHLRNHTTTSPKPTNSKTVTIEEDNAQQEFTAITEGKATILFPGGGEVFYNPIQNFNRDLSVLAIRCFGEKWLEERARRRKEKKGSKNRRMGRQEKMTEGQVQTEEVDEKAQEWTTIMDEHQENGDEDEDMDGSEGTKLEAPTQSSGELALATSTEPPLQSPPNFRILDALSATGLRALRYALEIPFATSLVANDLSASAVASIHRNIRFNTPLNPSAIAKICPSTGNALHHMYLNPHRYHVIDLDPYGTAAPFLDAALQSIVTKDSGPGSGGGGGGGGLLCVTCTDAGVWASTGYSEKCYALYSGQPMKGDCSHEAGLRLILYSIATTAAKYGLAIKPLLSLSIDFYARVFVRVKASAAQVKHLASQSMLVYNCDSGCGAWQSVPLGRADQQASKRTGREGVWKFRQPQVPSESGNCEHCGFRMHIAGPMWAGELHDEEFLRSLLDIVDRVEEDQTGEGKELVYTTLPRVRGMVSTALDECTFLKVAEERRRAREGQDNQAELLPQENHSAGDPTPNQPPPSHPPPRTNPPYPPLPSPHFFLIPTRLSKIIHSVAPPQASLRGALLHLGYSVSRSHCKPNSIKTDAPYLVVWEIMRQWVSKHAPPIKISGIPKSSSGWRILFGRESEENIRKDETELTIGQGWTHISEKVGEVVFDEGLGRDEERDRGRKVKSEASGEDGGVGVWRGREVRYQQNPTANWGPMKAAKGASAVAVAKATVRDAPSTGKRKGEEMEDVKGERGTEREGEVADGEREEKKIKRDISNSYLNSNAGKKCHISQDSPKKNCSSSQTDT